MTLRLAVLPLLLGVGQSGIVYPFCSDGVSKADFADNEAVEVIFAQAPLFSSNPKFGDKGKYLNLFHTTIILSQGAGATRRYWTLEFDYMKPNVLHSLAPYDFNLNLSAPGGVTMVWDNDIRYCLNEGIKWGRKHWSKSFEVIFTVTSEQAKEAMSNFVGKMNTTTSGNKPQYQVWRVATRWPEQKMLLQDTTCADGANWFLHHFMKVHKAIPPPGFEFKGTVTYLNAESIRPVDMNDWIQVDKMVLWYKVMADMIAPHHSILRRGIDALALLNQEIKYVYDANTEVYYEVLGNKFPWFSYQYAHYPIQGPWWHNDLSPNSTKTDASTMIV